MRLDIYVRVSSLRGRDKIDAGERFHSPTWQRELCEGWAALHEVEIGAVFEELDMSGGRPDRPLWIESIERVERGQSDGIVVAELDRFGRSLLHAITAVERIHTAGGTFVSVKDGIDMRTAAGEYVMNMHFSNAQFYRRRIGESWDASRRSAVARGVHPVPFAPYGYRRQNGGRLEIDPVTGPIAVEIFDRRAAGEEMKAIERWLQGNRVSGPRSARFQRGTLYPMIANRAYIGDAHAGRYRRVDAHPALIDPVVWERAQNPRRTPAGLPGTWLALTVARCASCSRLLHAHAGNKDRTKHAYYTCGRHRTASPCPRPTTISRSRLDAFVAARLKERLAGFEPDPDAASELLRLEEEVSSLNAELNARLRVPQAPARAGERDAVAEDLERRLRAVRLELGSARDRLELAPAPPSDWRHLDGKGRRLFVDASVDAVFIAPGDLQAYHRVFICWKGESPVDLPQLDGVADLATRFEVGTCVSQQARTRPLPLAFDPLPVEAVEAQVALLARELGHMPTESELKRRGRSDLWSYFNLYGGRTNMAERLGLSLVASKHYRGRWTEAEIATALDAYLADREFFPSQPQFRREGRGGLYRALSANDRRNYWIERSGLPRTPRRARPRQWPQERIEHDLRSLITDLGIDHYPTQQQFIDAGAGRLFQAIYRHQGHEHFVALLGLRRRRSQTPVVLDDRLRADLEAYIAPYGRMPMQKEFVADGQQRLYYRARSRGGIRAWRSALELTVPAQRKQ